jgi:uncharacterized protein YqjF (DUF2071 family)
MPMPPAPPFLTARWVHLAIANFQIDPAVLHELVPTGTEIDLWRGNCFVSMVGFQFLDTRVRGMAIPFHRDFEEVNLRFYVKRVVDGQPRRGVVFLKEIVPKRAIAWIANRLYNEKYIVLPMSHQHNLTALPRTVAYTWRYHGERCRLRLTLDGKQYLPAEDSEEAFITEHYWGYTAQRDGSTLEYKVEHPRWNVWKGTNPEFVCDVAALYGVRFAPFLNAPPASCFVADGSDVVVRRGQKV